MDYIVEILEKLKTVPSESLESEEIEFKCFGSETSFYNAKDLTDEISALANTKGGFIIIGVVDSSNVKKRLWETQLQGFDSVDLDTAKERILGRLNPKNLNIKLSQIDFEEKNYLIVYVPKVSNSIVTTSSGKTFIRVGKSSMPCTPEQIEQKVKSLQTYDWSSELLQVNANDVLNISAVEEAKLDYCKRRSIENLSNSAFLESIEATRNGVLNKGGMLFLGKSDSIREHLGSYEYRFTWKTKTGELKINDVWDDCLWNTIKRSKKHFEICNEKITINYEEKDYDFNKLDRIAFHEAYLNSLVHRDYGVDGMTTINFTDNKLSIINPGKFYGGVTSSNITYHEPRHRNKGLARTLMVFQLVDRAGMGVLRMGLHSLRYGREFPKFIESENSVQVVMQTEYFRAGIFILTHKYITNCGIIELLILNSIFKKGFVNVKEIESKLTSVGESSWEKIFESVNTKPFSQYVEFRGTNKGLFLCNKSDYNLSFEVTKSFRAASNSEKHIKLYNFLKQNESGNNEELRKLLGFSGSPQTYQFLSKLEYTVNKGKTSKSVWLLKK